ncbi:hypothetical protein BVRB_8g187840 [Beta vulgaris subsp. vulgaris]|nr:hypothetical protein BVRB_8g187840 [Beta vulgaris subsp. vulgaris]
MVGNVCCYSSSCNMKQAFHCLYMSCSSRGGMSCPNL